SAPCPRFPACRYGDSRTARTCSPSRRSPSARAAARAGGCHAFRAAPRTSSRAEFCEERISCELDAERRLRTVTRVHDGLRWETVGERSDGVDERFPIRAGEVGSTDGAREEDVARAKTTVRVIGEMGRGGTGGAHGRERDPG